MMPQVTSQLLSAVPNVHHGFSLRGVVIEDVALQFPASRFFRTDQIHGACVHLLERDPDETILEGDAFGSDRIGTICSVRTADCVPILIADRSGKAVAAVHAGWRGTAQDIVGKTVRELTRAYGIAACDCVAAIGPRICGSCYEVGQEVIDALEDLAIGDAWRVPARTRHVDLGKANRALLLRAGLPESHIDLLEYCTFCDDRFTSYRRDASEAGRQVNWILKQSKVES